VGVGGIVRDGGEYMGKGLQVMSQLGTICIKYCIVILGSGGG
jgi:hypothetical protein